MDWREDKGRRVQINRYRVSIVLSVSVPVSVSLALVCCAVKCDEVLYYTVQCNDMRCSAVL